MTCRSKIAKIVPIGNPRWPDNLFIPSSTKPKSQLTPNLDGSIRMTYRSKIAKIILSEIQDGRHGGHLENLFFASSSELKGQLTRNLVGSIVMICRSKIAKIVPIGNQDGYLGSHFENLFFDSSPKLKMPIDSKLGRKHQVDL